MQQKVIKWFNNNVQNWKNTSYLLAASGGVDSVVLCHLFQNLGLNFEVAHCNFNLRGKESEGDEEFVKNLASQLKVEFNVIHFETKELAKKEKLSTQEAARKLRYNWFENLRREKKLDLVAVGTHKSDETETMLINLIRGAGIRGLHGIIPNNNGVIRPLLSVARKEIMDWANSNNLKWREDSSNESDNYMRNNIRHHVIPPLKEIRENIEEQFSESAEAIRDYQQVLENEIARLKPTIMTREKEYWKIDKSALLALKPTYVYLYELLIDFGFSYWVCKDIVGSIQQKSQPGGVFHGTSATLVNDRNYLIVKPNRLENLGAVGINETTSSIKEPLNLNMEVLDISSFQLDKSPNNATIDFSKLHFPLTLRPWKNGDRFQPFGMQGMKKVSDFLIDQKIPRNLKKGIYVLECKNEIVWVVGFRIDDRFKVDENTDKVYQLELI